MKKWFCTMIALLAASAAALVFMGSAVMAKKEDMPAVITMEKGEISDFSAIGIRATLLDNDYGSRHWWKQTITFGNEVETETSFFSQTEKVTREMAEKERVRSSSELRAFDYLWQRYTDGSTVSGTYYIKDLTDTYEYTISLWEEYEDGRLITSEVDFPWLWSAVGSEDKVVVEKYDTASHISDHTSGLYADVRLLRIDGEYYFTLPNTFHGKRATSGDTGMELEIIEYGGSSGIFRLRQDTGGGLVYDDNAYSLAQAEQLFALPISSEDDTIVLRLDYLEKTGLLSLLSAEDGELILRLFDIGTGTCGEPVRLGDAFVNEKDAEDGIPDDVHVKAQDDVLMILKGGFGDQPSRAIVLQVDAQDEVQTLMDVTFDLENRNYRQDEWMVWQDGSLYYLEGSEWWSSSLRVAAIDQNGVRALGELQNLTARIEIEKSSHNYDYSATLPGFFNTIFPDFLGWTGTELCLMEKEVN